MLILAYTDMSEKPPLKNIKKYLNTLDKSGIAPKFSKEKINQVSGFYSEESERKTVAHKIKESRIQEKRFKELSQEILKKQSNILNLKPATEALKARRDLLKNHYSQLDSLEVSLLSKIKNRNKIQEIKQEIGNQSSLSLTQEIYKQSELIQEFELKITSLLREIEEIKNKSRPNEILLEYYKDKAVVTTRKISELPPLGIAPAYATLSDGTGYTDTNGQPIYDVRHTLYADNNQEGVELKAVKPDRDNEMIAHDIWEHSFGQAILNRVKIEFPSFNLGNGFTPNGECFIQGFEGVVEKDRFIDNEDKLSVSYVSGLKIVFEDYFGKNQMINMVNVEEVIKSFLLGHYIANSLSNDSYLITNLQAGKRAVKNAIVEGVYTNKHSEINFHASFLPIPELEFINYTSIAKKVNELYPTIMNQPEFVEMLGTLKNLKTEI